MSIEVVHQWLLLIQEGNNYLVSLHLELHDKFVLGKEERSDLILVGPNGLFAAGTEKPDELNVC